MIALWVAAGGAIGTLARYWLSLASAALLGEAMPWGTIAINVSGSFAIGVLAVATGADGRWPAPPELRAFLLVGLCGGYTTFSSFSLQTLALVEDGHALRGGLNVAASMVLCLIAVWLGSAALGPVLRR